MSIKVMDYVWAHSRQKGSALLLLLAIADHAHDDGDGAYPSLETLAQKTRMSIRQTQRLIKSLAAAEELEIKFRQGPQLANLYRVVTTCHDVPPVVPSCRGDTGGTQVVTSGVNSGDIATSPKPSGTVIEPSLTANAGAKAPEDRIPISLEGWLSAMKTERGTKNPIAVLAFAAHILSGGDPEKEVPKESFGRVGALTRQANSDYGLVMKLLWEASASRPAGSVINFATALLNGRRSREARNSPSLHERRLKQEMAANPPPKSRAIGRDAI